MDKGLMHLYCGDGKGKTTAAMGLALRALGRGKTVVIVQFLKSGTSGELEPLRRLGAVILSGRPDGGTVKFTRFMNENERAEMTAFHNGYLRQAAELRPDLLVLDEACAAVYQKMADEALMKELVLNRPFGQEIVLTGRNPAAWMTEAADYITEMKCCRHPYKAGKTAREGVEY